jgi:hypothetical protein
VLVRSRRARAGAGMRLRSGRESGVDGSDETDSESLADSVSDGECGEGG